MTTNEIRAVAAQTKYDFEGLTLSREYLASLVIQYVQYIAESYGDELMSWIDQSQANFPVNCCEIASAVLLDRIGTGQLAYGRYEHEPIRPENTNKTHTFWSASVPHDSEGLIADITADQYGGPPIFVGKLKQPWTIPDWAALAETKSSNHIL